MVGINLKKYGLMLVLNIFNNFNEKYILAVETADTNTKNLMYLYFRKS